MKGTLLFALLLAALPAFAQTPTISQSAAAAWGGTKTGSVSVAATAGHTLWVGCNLPSGFAVTSATDNQGDTFTLQQTQVLKTVSQAQYVFIASNIKGGTTKVTCTANAAPGSGEIYVLDVAGADPKNPVCASASFDGTTGKASGSLTLPVANCLVLAYAVSGTVSNASGWTALSTLDSNLTASIAGGKAGAIISASFGVSQDWSLVLFALQPFIPPAKPFVYQLQGGPQVSFPMTIPPACGPADGPSCTITIQITDANGNVVLSGVTGTISLVKSGAQGTQVFPVAVAGPASQ
jgi:hypothetical protein